MFEQIGSGAIIGAIATFLAAILAVPRFIADTKNRFVPPLEAEIVKLRAAGKVLAATVRQGDYDYDSHAAAALAVFDEVPALPGEGGGQ